MVSAHSLDSVSVGMALRQTPHSQLLSHSVLTSHARGGGDGGAGSCGGGGGSGGAPGDGGGEGQQPQVPLHSVAMGPEPSQVHVPCCKNTRQLPLEI